MEQAVIVHLRLTEGKMGSDGERAMIEALGDALEQVINKEQAGEFDGEEMGDWRCVLFMYGPNADRIFDIVEPILKASPLARGGSRGQVIRRGWRCDCR